MAQIAVLYPQLPLDGAEEAALREAKRIAEALLFAAAEPVEESELRKRLPDSVNSTQVLEALKADYSTRGVNLVRVGSKWIFRTAADLGYLLSRETQEQKKLSRAALETLAIVAYHQPVTRAEIEDIRGVAISKGTMDVLIETGWVRLRGRRKAPGRPVTYGTTDNFLLHFGLEAIGDLPGLEELKGAGLFDGRLPAGFGVPTPNDSAELTDSEDPLEGDSDDLFAEVSEEAQAEASAAVDAAVDAVTMAEMEKVAEAMVEAIRAAEEELGEEDSDASEPDSQ
ncbi:MAG: scpB [Hyphomicrobiales bacterium]|nr:scpB [Hyphomicrobiales bacterium]